MSAVNAPKGLLVVSVLLYGIGVFLGRRASANVMSSVFITLDVLSLFYVGGWIYYLDRGHVLTPFAVSVGVFWFGLGAYTCARAARFVPGSEMNAFLSEKPVQLPHLDPGLLLGVWMMSIVTMLLVAWFFSQVGIIFLSENVAQARSTAMAGRGIVFRGVIALLPISFTVIYAFRRFTKWRNGFLLAAGIVALSVASVLMLGSRGFAAFFIIPGLIMIGYSRTRVNQWQILFLIVLFVLLAVGFQYRYRDYRDLSFATSIVTVLRRMTRSQAQGLDHIIYGLIPDRGFYRGGILWWDFRGLLATFRIVSLEQTFSSWLWQHLGAFQFPHENYTLSTTIIGDLYADYGLLAVSTGMLFYGALAQWLYIRVIRGRKHWFRIAMLCFAQYILISAHISGSIFGVFSIRGLSLILYFLLVRGFASVCVQRTRSHQCDQLHEDGMRIVFAEYVTYDSAYKVGGHHLSQYVAAAGHSVLYLSAPLHVGHLRHWFKRDDSSWYDLRNSFIEWWRGGISRSPNLVSYTPLTLVPPWRYGPLSSRWVLERTLGFTVPSLERRIGSLGFREPDVLVIAHPFLANMMGMVNAKLVVCRVNDDIGKFETMPPSVSAVERRIAREADVVIVTSRPLCEKFDYVSPDRLYYLPNGVDFQFYQSGMRNETAAELRSLDKPVIVYMGALNYWFDTDLLAYCAQRFPDYAFVLIGAVHTDLSALERLPNVHLLGRRPYEQLPTYLRACDVGIIPFRVSPLIEAVSPLKLYEYMACGLPVVATRWRELESLESPARLADSPEQFADMIEQACAEGERRRREYMDFARQNSWSARGERLLSIIGRHSELSPDR